MQLLKLKEELKRARTAATFRDCAISEDTKKELEDYMDTRIIEPIDKVITMINREQEKRRRFKERKLLTRYSSNSTGIKG